MITFLLPGMVAMFALVFLSGCNSNVAAPEPSTPAAPAAAVFPLKDYMLKAGESYAARTDLAKAREAYNIMAQAQKAQPADYEAAWTTAKYAYYFAAHTEDKSEAKEVFGEGIKAGRAAIELNANKPEGHFWLGANLGGRAKISMMDGAADTDEIRELMQAVIKIDPGFQSGSAYLALGQIDLELPRLMGGDPAEAVKVLETGAKYAENNSLYHYWLAKAYVDNDRKEDAKKQIERLKQVKVDPNYQPEHADALKLADELAASSL